MEYTIINIFIAIFGACIGSFLNVVISRLPEKGAFLSNNRSCCPFCNAVIKWYDLIPVLSFIILAARCRKCKAKISPRYLVVEILGIAFALSCVHYFGYTLAAPVAYAALMILLAIALIDFATSQIPDSLIIALIPVALGCIWAFDEVTLISRAIGFACLSLPMLGLSLIIQGAFGGGDIKLIAVCGFLLGWQNALAAFFIAVLLAGSVAIYLMATKKRQRGQHMVFGPAICSGVAAALFFGKELIGMYLSLFWV